MAIEVPDIPVTGTVIESAWGADVANSIAELDPSGAQPGQVLKVNSASDGYDFGGVDVPVGPTKWGTEIGVKYVVVFGDSDMTTAAQVNTLGEAGWTTSGVVVAVTGPSSDFLSDSDAGPSTFAILDSPGDRIHSPVMFGDYGHACAVQGLLGAFPTKLKLACLARFLVASNNEEDTCIGFFNGTGTTDQEITIHSDGTNFRLRMEGTGTEDAGAAIDTNWHLFEIHVSENLTEWFIDGVSQGSIAEDADDQWPMCFAAEITPSTGANDIYIAWASVEYALN